MSTTLDALKQRIRGSRDLCGQLGHPPARKQYHKTGKGRRPASWWCQCGRIEWAPTNWR